MGWGSSAPANTTTTVTNQPPEYLQPYSEQYLNQAANIASQPMGRYPGTQMAPISPLQEAGIYGMARRGMEGSPVNRMAQDQAYATGAGAFNPSVNWMGNASETLAGNQGSQVSWQPNLQQEVWGNYGNPYLTGEIQRAQNEQIPGIGFMSRQGGSYGNTGIAEAAAKNMGNIASSMRFAGYDADRNRQMGAINTAAQLGEGERNRQMQAMQMGQQGWDSERNRQIQAAQLAPALAQTDYADLQKLMEAGDVQRQYQQQIIDYASGAWDDSRQWPYSQSDWFANSLRAAGFGSGGDMSTTAPNPNRSSSFANLMGGGMALGGLYDILSRS